MGSRDVEIRHIVQRASSELLVEHVESEAKMLYETDELRTEAEVQQAVGEFLNLSSIMKAWSEGRPGK
jgi:hypothetical protein